MKSGDAVIASQDTRCTIRTTPAFAETKAKVGCRNRMYEISGSNKRIFLSGDDFCRCPKHEQWFQPSSSIRENRIQEWPEDLFTVSKMYSGKSHCIVKAKRSSERLPDRTSEIRCRLREHAITDEDYERAIASGGSISAPTIRSKPFERLGRIDRDAFVDIGATTTSQKAKTNAYRLCRCAEEDREGDWDVFDVSEQGKGALRKECQRTKMAGDECKRSVFFSDPTDIASGEDAMKRAIMYGGPIVSGFDVYENGLEEHDGTGVFQGFATGTRRSVGGHDVVLFGWGTTTQGEKFWWARNSWGKKCT